MVALRLSAARCAERKAGQLLAKMEKAQGKRTDLVVSRDQVGKVERPTDKSLVCHEAWGGEQVEAADG